MKRVWKQISLFMAAVLCVGIVGLLTFEYRADAAVSGEFEYAVGPNGAVITAYNGSSTSVTIPTTVGGHTVYKIEVETFKGSNIKSITVPKGITVIGKRAFEGCKYLTNVSLPVGMKEIQDSAFADCTSLTSIVLPEGLEDLSSWVFEGCTKLSSVTIPNSVTTIWKSVFNNCGNIKTVVVPKGVTSISKYAFDGCMNLQSIQVSEENATYLSMDGALLNKEGYELLICPEGKTGEYHVPEGVWRIDDHALYNCVGIRKIVLPSTIDDVSGRSFEGCVNLVEIDIVKEHPYLCEEDGVIYSIEKDTLYYCIPTKTGEYHVPEEVSDIRGFSFYNCDGLTSIVFENRERISIDDCALDQCDNLKSLTFYSEMISGPMDRLGNIPPLTIYVPNTEYDQYVDEFSWNVPEGTTFAAIQVPPPLFEYKTTGMGAVITGYNGSEKEVVVPERIYGNTVIEIGEKAFLWNTEVEKISLPDRIEKIGANAFSCCSNLAEINIPESVTAIDQYAFRDCSNLKNINLPEGLTEIGLYAFYGCSSLTNVTIPSTVEKMAVGVFYNCSNLMAIQASSDNGNYSSVDGVLFDKDMTTLCEYPRGRDGEYCIPDGVSKIGASSFAGSKLSEITIPQGVTDIMSNAFSYSNNLESIFIPASVNNLNRTAFNDCENLTTIEVSEDNETYCSESGVLFDKGMTKIIKCLEEKVGTYEIPEGVVEIQYKSFENCNKLKSITFPEGVTKIFNDAFLGCDSLRIIYVPEASYDSYVELLTEKLPEGVQIRVIGDIPPLYYGDANADYFVDANDALIILKHVVKLQKITDATALQLADVDHNEVIEAADALSTLKIVVKLQEAEVFQEEAA